MEEEIMVTRTTLRKAFDLWLKEIAKNPKYYKDVDWSNPPEDYSKVATNAMFEFLKSVS